VYDSAERPAAKREGIEGGVVGKGKGEHAPGGEKAWRSTDFPRRHLMGILWRFFLRIPPSNLYNNTEDRFLAIFWVVFDLVCGLFTPYCPVKIALVEQIPPSAEVVVPQVTCLKF